MSRRSNTLELAVSPARAEAACRGAVSRLGWELDDTAGPGVVGREDIAQLCCHSWPCEVEISITEAGGERSRLDLRAHVAGIGPLSSRRVREGLGALERAIRTEVEAAG